MKIPIYNRSTAQLTEQSPNRLINRDEMSPSGDTISAIGGAVSDIGQMIEQAYTALEKERAANDYDIALQNILTQEDTDQDV